MVRCPDCANFEFSVPVPDCPVPITAIESLLRYARDDTDVTDARIANESCLMMRKPLSIFGLLNADRIYRLLLIARGVTVFTLAAKRAAGPTWLGKAVAGRLISIQTGTSSVQSSRREGFMTD